MLNESTFQSDFMIFRLIEDEINFSKFMHVTFQEMIHFSDSLYNPLLGKTVCDSGEIIESDQSTASKADL